jgi:hypothetical protein
MADIAPDFLALLEALAEHQVDFIVVGGVCAVLHGAPVATFDLDVVHARAPENLGRLLTALHALDAYYREQPERKLRPTLSHLASSGHQLLLTRSGPLDLLGTIGEDLAYEDLLAQTTELAISERLRVRLLNLETLIAIKEEMAREKDQAVLPTLRRTLEEKNKPEA